MAYTRMENLGSYGERRIVGIFTQSNIVGFLLGLCVMWQLASLVGLPADGLNMPTLIRVGLSLVGGGGGLMATFRWTGMSMWDRVLLWVMYVWRQRLGKTVIRPSAAPMRSNGGMAGPLMRNGRVIAEVYDPTEGYADE